MHFQLESVAVALNSNKLCLKYNKPQFNKVTIVEKHTSPNLMRCNGFSLRTLHSGNCKYSHIVLNCWGWRCRWCWNTVCKICLFVVSSMKLLQLTAAKTVSMQQIINYTISSNFNVDALDVDTFTLTALSDLYFIRQISILVLNLQPQIFATGGDFTCYHVQDVPNLMSRPCDLKMLRINKFLLNALREGPGKDYFLP